jgi:hypothetical protein
MGSNCIVVVLRNLTSHILTELLGTLLGGLMTVVQYLLRRAVGRIDAELVRSLLSSPRRTGSRHELDSQLANRLVDPLGSMLLWRGRLYVERVRTLANREGGSFMALTGKRRNMLARVVTLW